MWKFEQIIHFKWSGTTLFLEKNLAPKNLPVEGYQLFSCRLVYAFLSPLGSLKFQPKFRSILLSGFSRNKIKYEISGKHPEIFGSSNVILNYDLENPKYFLGLLLDRTLSGMQVSYVNARHYLQFIKFVL